MTAAVRALRGAAFALALFAPAAALAADEHFLADGIAARGHDVVAYHTMGKPTPGDAAFSATYQGVTWLFASAEHRDLFAAEPGRYAPAYGGWCSVGAAKGKKIAIDPQFFAVVDGQLYLNSSQGAHENVFLQDTAGTIAKGERNWKVIFATEADQL
jgi:YHS domain-containing protein